MKTCTKCGECKPVDAFVRRSRLASGYAAECKACQRIRRAKYYADHAEQAKAASREAHRAMGPERAREKRHAWVAANLERSRELARKYYAKKATELTDAYVAYQAARRRGVKPADVPPHVIQLKREQLSLHRLAKEMQQASTQAQEKS